MRTLLNIIWVVLSGFWLAVLYAILGVLLCATIVLIPFGLQLFKIARYALWPFGRTAVRSPNATGMSTLGNVLWLIPGLVLALGHLITAFLSAITVIGFPLAYANVKLIPMALTPFGREIVKGSEMTDALAAYRAMQSTPAGPTATPLPAPEDPRSLPPGGSS